MGALNCGEFTSAPAEELHIERWQYVMMGKYQMDMSLRGVLGEGTSCICRKGKDVGTGELVAIKTYKGLTGSSTSPAEREAILKRFERSVEVLKKLHEPFQQPEDPKLWSAQLDHVKPANLFMSLLDYTKDADGKACCDPTDGNLYVITELAQQSLRGFLDKRRKDAAPPSKETVRSIANSIVLVMAGLHAQGFVHLDVKPENLMVFDGCLKLIDVDGCVEIGSHLFLDDSSVSFSPAYCAPEWGSFMLGEKKNGLLVSPGLDAWSVGCTICELVTLDSIIRPNYAKLPRREKNGKALFMKWLKRLEKAPLPKEMNQLDEELVQFITNCLLVCNKSERSTCAESLNTPYLARRRLQRTKTNPLTSQVYEDESLSMATPLCAAN